MYIAFSFLLTWNVIAMEAAACYIGETRNPDRDAKIAMNLEGALRPVHLHDDPDGVHDRDRRSRRWATPRWSIPKTIFVNFASKVFGAGAGSNMLNWLIAIMLILALILSALNAITGTARSLHQMSIDGQFPQVLPARQPARRPGPLDDLQRRLLDRRSCSSAARCEIYTFSNVGYLASFIPVLVGYYLLRKHRPNVRRPFRLPEWMKYVALALAALYAVIYFYGGPVYAIVRLQRRPGTRRCPTTSSAGACCSPTCRCTGGASARTT